MNNKKTLYEILEVSPQASQPEIQIAHLRATQKLQSAPGSRTPVEIETEWKVVNMAFQTLSNEKLRKSYDARLNPQVAHVAPVAAPAPTPTPQTPPTALNSLTLVSKVENASALSMKAEAASLKADAATMMAQAALMKADAINLHNSGGSTLKVVNSVGKGLRFVLTMLGSFFVLVLFLAWCGSGRKQADEKAHERLIIEQHYQQYGVRPKSKAEAELMEAEHKRTENARREVDREAQKVRDQEREHQRFVEDSRRLGQEVSRKVQYEAERAERQERMEAERKAQQEQQEKFRKEEAERRRLADDRRRLGLPP